MAETSKYIYDFGGFKYSTAEELNKEQLTDLYDKFEATGVADPQLNEAEDLHRSDLIANKEFLNSYKDFFHRTKGEDFKGTDEELVDDYYSQMRHYDFNLPALGDLAFKLQGEYFDETTKQNIAVMWDTWERVAPFYTEKGAQWGGFFKDFTVSTLTDITNLVNIGGVVGTGLRATAQKAAAEAVKYQIKNKLIKKALGTLTSDVVKQGIIRSASEGALMSFADDQGRQAVNKQILGQEGTNWGQSALVTGIGATLGGAFGALGATGTKAGVDKAGVDVESLASKSEFFKKTDKILKTFKQGASEKQIKAKEVSESIFSKRHEVVNAYQQWADELDLIKKEGLGKEAREKATAFYYDRIGKFLDGTNDSDVNANVYFKARGNDRIPFDTATSKDVVMDVLKIADVKPEDDFVTLAQKVMDKKVLTKLTNLGERPIKVDGKKVGTIDANSQYDAVLISLQTSLYNDMKMMVDSELPEESIVDVINTFVKLTGTVKLRGTGAGRQLYYHRFNTFKDFDIDALKGLDSIEKVNMVEKMVAAGDINKAMQYSASVSKWLQAHGADKTRRVSDWMKELYISNVLGGTSSLFFNNASSFAQMGFRIPQRYLAGVTVGGTKGQAMRREAAAQLNYLADVQMWGHSLQLAYDSFLKSKGNIDSRHFLEESGHAFTKDIDFTKGLSDIDSFSQVVKNAIKLVGHRGMITSDELMGNLAFRSRAYGIAFSEAMSEKGMTKAGAMDIAKKRVEEAVAKQLDAITLGHPSTDPLVKKALAETRQVKYQTDLEKGFDVGQIGRTIQKWSHPVYSEKDGVAQVLGKSVRSFISTMVVPFTRTPANLINESFEMTPGLAMLSKRFRREIASGDPERVAMANTKLMLGAGIWGASIAAVANGDFSGDGAADYSQRKVQKGANRLSAYKIPDDVPVIGGMSFDRFEPFNAPLKLLVDMQDILRYGTDLDAQQAYTAMSVHMADLLTDYPAFQGAQRIAQLGSAWGSDLEFGEKVNKTEVALGRYLASFVPFYRIINEHYGQDQVRELRSWLDPIKQNIPYLRDFGDLRRDPIFGKPATRDPYLIDGPLYVLAPMKKGKKSNDIVDQEIVRQGLKMGAPVPRITVNGGNTPINLLEYTFDPEKGRTYYDRYCELVGEIKAPMFGIPQFSGKTLYEALESIITSDFYTDQATHRTFSGKIAGDKSVIKVPRQEALENVISTYRKFAQRELLEEVRKRAVSGDKEAIKMAKDIDLSKRASLEGNVTLPKKLF